MEIMLNPLQSPKKTLQDALWESEERYRALLDGIRNYAIFMMDPQGTIQSWNAGAERIKGYTANEIIGRNFACFRQISGVAGRKKSFE